MAELNKGFTPVLPSLTFLFSPFLAYLYLPVYPGASYFSLCTLSHQHELRVAFMGRILLVAEGKKWVQRRNSWGQRVALDHGCGPQRAPHLSRESMVFLFMGTSAGEESKALV